jgi:hypothetical protein
MSREVDSSAFIRYIHGVLVSVEAVECKGITQEEGRARNTACHVLFSMPFRQEENQQPGLVSSNESPFCWRGTDQWLKSR